MMLYGDCFINHEISGSRKLNQSEFHGMSATGFVAVGLTCF